MVRPYRLFLMRHLPTPGNYNRQYIGWTDESIDPSIVVPPLAMLRDVPIVLGSDLMRARQSAQLVAPHARYIADARLRESHFGEFEGKTYEQLQANPAYRNWLDQPEHLAPPGGETLQGLRARVLQAVQEMMLPHQSMVMTHGGPIRILLETYAPEPESFWSWTVSHGWIWCLEWTHHNHLKEGKRCKSLSVVHTMESGDLLNNN